MTLPQLINRWPLAERKQATKVSGRNITNRCRNTWKREEKGNPPSPPPYTFIRMAIQTSTPPPYHTGCALVPSFGHSTHTAACGLLHNGGYFLQESTHPRQKSIPTEEHFFRHDHQPRIESKVFDRLPGQAGP